MRRTTAREIVLVAHDRPRHELRKHRDIGGEVDEETLPSARVARQTSMR